MNFNDYWLSAIPRRWQYAILGLASIVGVYWAWVWWQTPSLPDHRHIPGTHGGVIVAVGHDHYHVEAVFTADGTIKLFMLGQDQTRVVTVPRQKIAAYVRSANVRESVPMQFDATPQLGDPEGQTSAFEGRLPLEFVGSTVMVVVPSIQIGESRYRFGFVSQAGHEPEMPQKVTDAAERELYLMPGGKFTDADIKANGSLTASQKYRGFQSAHDMHPHTGQAICPVTHTKANPRCTWIVNGKSYQFCCPPCIDEFVKLAKEHPEQIREPTEYVQH